MIISDIVTFAKNGISPSDMKDLISKGYTAQDITYLLAVDVEKDERDHAEENPQMPPVNPSPNNDGADETPDYKSLYEAEKKRREELERLAAHKETDDSNQKGDYDIAIESVKTFI